MYFKNSYVCALIVSNDNIISVLKARSENGSWKITFLGLK